LGSLYHFKLHFIFASFLILGELVVKEVEQFENAIEDLRVIIDLKKLSELLLLIILQLYLLTLRLSGLQGRL
jgi:hypothetical protein